VVCGGLQWFAVVCGGLRWFARFAVVCAVCGGLCFLGRPFPRERKTQLPDRSIPAGKRFKLDNYNIGDKKTKVALPP
jgi:hypothetical protein